MAVRTAQLDVRQVARPLFLVLGALVLVNVAAWLLWVRPTTERYRNLLESTGPEVERLEERSAEVEAREEYLRALHEAESNLGTLKGEVLGTRDERLVDVQLELAELCDQFGIPLASVNYANEWLEDEGLERFAMVVPLEGGYKNLRRFLQAVEKSDEFLIVERVQLAQGKEGGVLLQLNITLTTYFEAPEPAGARRASRTRT